ncbi:MAG: EamA family transporter [Bacteroidales bacterium]|nr:EamA family transporter [Bacteroidales bacterium]
MWKLISLSILQSLFLCGGQVLLKLGLVKSGPFSWSAAFFRSQLTNWWFPACGVSFTVAGVLWFYLLKHYPFSIAYPLSCISYIFGMVAALLVFGEQVSWLQWLGVLLIMAGCALIVK